MPKNRPEMQYAQAPTLIQLATMGWEILTEKEVSDIREHDTHEPLLLSILQESLRRLNPDITASEISTFISRLTSSETGNLTEDNHRVFEHITKGITINRIVDGRPEPRTFRCVDWVNIENNKLHAVAEFNYYGDRFDIVLFVNGIPLGLIECKSSDIQQGIKEINYYTDKHPSFFLFIQFTATISAMKARYGTVKAGVEFYSVWREDIPPVTWGNLSPKILSQIFSGRLQGLGENLPSDFSGERVELVAGIFNPYRFLNLIKYYVVNDGGIKKVPRYQQFFVVEESLKRLKKREGGVIWHTQGSGKSLTMALLAQNIFSRLEAPDAQIILVTDRINLDSQLFNTFRNCNINTIAQASNSNELKKFLTQKTPIIATVINKFDGIDKDLHSYDSPDIFVFVDEAHRSQNGELATKMRALLPQACFIGFSGTPLFKKDKSNTFNIFGDIIPPSYTIRTAIEDGAIVPLLYEARYLDKNVINQEDLEKELRKEILPDDAPPITKYGLISKIKSIPQIIEEIASDIHKHYKENFQGKDGRAWAKAQLAVDTRKEALMYYRAFQKLGGINVALVISKGLKDDADLKEFFQEIGLSDKKYTDQIISLFSKETQEIELLIVADRLLTGFDAQINTVLYLNKLIKDHSLLQAIARVNRVYNNKEYGRIVDYLGLLGALTEALDSYDVLAGFDPRDLQGALIPITEETRKLPDLLKKLLCYFNANTNQQYILDNALRIFIDESKRDFFYSDLSEYAKTLWLCLSSDVFYKNTPQIEIDKYKEYLITFQNVKKTLVEAYSDKKNLVNNNDKLLKLLENHISGGDILKINEPIDIMDKAQVENLQSQSSNDKDLSITTSIYAMKRYAETHQQENPAFYEEFLRRLKDIIEAHKKQMFSDVETLFNMQQELKEESTSLMPDSLKSNDVKAYYQNILQELIPYNSEASKAIAEDITLQLDIKLSQLYKFVRPWGRKDDIRRISSDLTFFIYEDMNDKYSLGISIDDAEKLIEKLMGIAEIRHVNSRKVL